MSILIATGQLTFQSDSLSKIGADCFLPNMQNININVNEINDLVLAVRDKIPSSEEIVIKFEQLLANVKDKVNSFNIHDEEKVPEASASDASDDHVETLEIEQMPVKQEMEVKKVKQDENAKQVSQKSSKTTEETSSSGQKISDKSKG